MRLKEFIIFIIIFTIIYFVGFAIFDHFQRKRDLKKASINKQKLIDLNKYQKFASFYQISPIATQEILNNIYTSIQNNYYINLTTFSSGFGISPTELVVIILFFEYIGIINKRGISLNNDCTIPLNDNDESLIMKYSLYLSNKMDYNSIIRGAGFNSNKELEYLNSKLLLPGVIINNNEIYYVGDLDE